MRMEEKKISKEVWGIGMKFYSLPRRDFIFKHFIKIAFIGVCLSTLYVIGLNAVLPLLF
jgi:hypothetical protein